MRNDLNLISNLTDDHQETTVCDGEIEQTKHRHVCDEDIGQRPQKPAVGENDVEKEDVVEDAKNEDCGDDDEADGQCRHEFAVLEVDRVVWRIDASLIWQTCRGEMSSRHHVSKWYGFTKRRNFAKEIKHPR